MQKVKAAAVSQADNNPTVKVITKEMAERRRLEKVALEVQKPRLVLPNLLAFWDTRNVNSVYTQLLPLQIVVSLNLAVTHVPADYDAYRPEAAIHRETTGSRVLAKQTENSIHGRWDPRCRLVTPGSIC